MNYSWIKKEIVVPPLAKIITLITLIVLPNLFFLGLAWYSATARPLFNIDYLFALFLIIFPWKIVRVLGGMVLIFAMLFDILMFVVQIFPFMDLAAIRYLVSFTSSAPSNYIIIVCILLICILIILCLSFYYSKSTKIDITYSFFILVSFFIICYVFMTLNVSYAQFSGILGRNNYYIAHSQSLLYREVTKSDFWNDANVTPRLLPQNEDQHKAANYLQYPHSRKILYILAESWGEFRDIEAQKTVVENIFGQKDKFESLSLGSFYTIGSTVSGELRELCGLRLANNGFALSRVEKSIFSNCLPEQLKQQDYVTIALHGTSGLLYDRTSWYPKAGFKEVLFGEHFMDLHHCTPFKGVCDSELMNVVATKFKEYVHQNLFFYWMTLTSHQPYAKQDIRNQRFDCEKFRMNPKGDACHNAQLQAQFFDDLAKLIQQPEMKGVEVIVVGDHQPPIWGEDIKHVRPLTVGFLHFKVKESD